MRKPIFFVVIVLMIIFLSGCGYKVKKNTDIGTEAAKIKVEKLIADGGGEATVKGVAEDGDLYKAIIDVNGQEQPVYVTKDGTKFIQQAISFEDIEKEQVKAKKREEELNKEITKSDKPTVDLYVMSFCPYGNKAEDTLKPVYNLLKNKVDFNFYYIVTAKNDKITSLHGQPEVDQNIREACVLKNYGKSKWMDFVTYINTNCGLDGKCWEDGIKALAIDATKINACFKSDGISLMKANAEKADTNGANGSPTMFINGSQSGVVYKYGNSEEYKKIICSAFNNAPAECEQILSSETVTTEGGSCGN